MRYYKSISDGYITAIGAGGGGTQRILYKAGGAWAEAQKVWKKVNGSWVLQGDLTSVFDNNTNYVKG